VRRPFKVGVNQPTARFYTKNKFGNGGCNAYVITKCKKKLFLKTVQLLAIKNISDESKAIFLTNFLK